MSPEEIESAERERLAQEAAARAKARLAERREREALAFERKERRKRLMKKITSILGLATAFAVFFLFLAYVIPKLKSGRPSASLLGNYTEKVKKEPVAKAAETTNVKSGNDALFIGREYLKRVERDTESIKEITEEIRLLTANLQSKTS